MNRRIRCGYCGMEVIPTAKDVKQETLTVDEEELTLTFFLCPFCANHEFEFMDNKETERLKKDALKVFQKKLRLKRVGRCLDGKDKHKLAMLEMQLNHKRAELLNTHQKEVYQLLEKLDSDDRA